ncbi:RNA polymerase sigma factor [Planctomycetota bacterium]|nr:RNA polymerase sigma factor [Planctomycetota bacterium]
MSPPTTSPTTEFAPLFKRLGPALYRQAAAILGDRVGAEDVVQDAFVRIWRRRERLDPARIDGYLFAAVRNLALDRLRRAKRAASGQLLVAAAGAEEPADGPDTEKINAALCGLPAEQREVVVLRVHQGLSFAEIAEHTETRLGTVHSRYRYAMERLREALSPLAPERAAHMEEDRRD